jgi:hypothetical protein
MPTASNPSACASSLIALARAIDQCGEQSNRTMNCAEHCADWQRLQAPVTLVFQSVPRSSNRHCTLPPFEMVVQGLVEPGK